MNFNIPIIHRLFVMICCFKRVLSSVLSDMLSEEKKSTPFVTLRQKQVQEVNPFQLPGSSSNNYAHAAPSKLSHGQLEPSSSSTQHSTYVIIQTGLCRFDILNCENIPTAEACHTCNVQSKGSTLVIFEAVTSIHPCLTSSPIDVKLGYFNQAKSSTNIANQGYRFVCDSRKQSSLLATTSTSTISTHDSLKMKCLGSTVMVIVSNCPTIETSGWNEPRIEWSASCKISSTAAAASSGLSIPLPALPPLLLPLEGEGGGNKERDGRTAVVVSSFGSVMLRWSHSIFWNGREGR